MLLALVMAGSDLVGAQLTPAGGEEGIFREPADSAFDFVHFNGAAGDYLMPEITCGGVALFDYDLDGDLDVYMVQGNMLIEGRPEDAFFPPPAGTVLQDRFYRNDLEVAEDGRKTLRFVDVTAESGLLAPGYGCGVAVGDFDNDGWPDLYIANVNSNQLFKNQGDGTFVDVTVPSKTDDPRWSVPTLWFDYDLDGWLDLFVGTYLEYDQSLEKVCRTGTGARDYCNPAAYAGLPDRLFRNQGDGTFEQVPLGSERDPIPSKSLGAVAGDFNGDSLPDLYVTNDGVANQLWIQQPGGGFEDEALLAGCALNRQGRPEASMGVDAGDFDGDGDLDLFMTHLSGETNTLYLNDGHGNFQDATVTAGLGPPSWSFTSWGMAWADYDNDGRLDLAIVNGAVRAIEELANRGERYPFHQPNQLFHSEGDWRYSDVTAQAGPAFALSEVSRALAKGDLDNDGDIDLVQVNNGGPARVLVNSVGSDQHWLGVRLAGHGGVQEMYGARLELIPDGASPSWRWVRADGSFGASNDARVLYGLGREAGQASLAIHWPAGGSRVVRLKATDRYFTFWDGKR
ncbi:MAG: CRTAC1 family protein [bacterium]|nr:CRTAC1 family protein [bacterium]